MIARSPGAGDPWGGGNGLIRQYCSLSTLTHTHLRARTHTQQFRLPSVIRPALKRQEQSTDFPQKLHN